MDPITIVFSIIGALVLGSSSTALYFKWEDINFWLNGKKVAVLGERKVGKTTLLTFISKGIFINTYDATLATKKVEKRHFSIDELNILIRKTKDVSGADDIGAYNEWQKLFMDSDLIFYIVRADKLLEKESHTEERAKQDLEKIKSWAEESKNKKRWIFIIGNVWEPHPVYSSIRDSGDHVKFIESFQKLKSVETMVQIARTEANTVRVVLGSIANKESANKLITEIFSQVLQNG